MTRGGPGGVINLSRYIHSAVTRRRYQPRGVSISPLAKITAAPTSLKRPAAPGRLRWLPAAALLLPSAIFLFVFTYWSVLRVLGESFLVGRFAGDYRPGFGNYQRLFADAHFGRAALNNIVYAAGTIVPSLALALVFALALRETTRWTAVLRTPNEGTFDGTDFPTRRSWRGARHSGGCGFGCRSRARRRADRDRHFFRCRCELADGA